MFVFDQLADHASYEGCHIHPSANIAEGATIAPGCIVGANAVVGPDVVLDKNVHVGPCAIVSGHTSIGSETKIYPMATIGSDPQDLKYAGEPTQLTIGKNNNIREYVNISTGTVGGGGKTFIGDNNLFMVYVHVAHDCIIGDNNVFANGVALAGHIEIGNNVVFGGMAGGHQFTKYGDRVMVAAGAKVAQDVPPFCMVHGDRASINGLNVIGLRRSGLSRESIKQIKEMYKVTFNENLTLEDAIKKIEAEIEASEERDIYVQFLKASERGITR